MRTALPTALLLASLPAGLAAQAPAPGLRLYGPLNGNDTHLVDARGRIVHTWTSNYPPAHGVRLLEDGSLVRGVARHCGVANFCGGGIQRVALDGTLLWDYSYTNGSLLSHHDVEVLPNGNVLFIAFDEISHAQAIQLGRDPALLQGSVFRADHIVEVEPQGLTGGRVVWTWRALDHLVQDHDPTRANYGDVSAQPGRLDINYPPTAPSSEDWNHVNGIEYDPLTDRIVISSRTQSEIWVIDHSTTTAEAAGSTGGRWGRGGDILYRWGNPQAYDAGGPGDQQLFYQHAPEFIPPGHPGEGRLLVFNNDFQPNASAVFELELPLDAQGSFVLGPNGRYGPATPSWVYAAPGFYSRFISSARRLPNGNTLICSGAQRWVFEIDPAGRIVWEDTSPGGFVFHAQYTERSLFADRAEVSLAAGGSVDLDLIAGSAHAGERCLVLGSASGTTPGLPLGGALLPLNPDAFFVVTLEQPNTPPVLANTYAVLDANGRSRATIGVPAGALASTGPMELHFAALLLDPVTLEVRRASEAVGLTLRP